MNKIPSLCSLSKRPLLRRPQWLRARPLFTGSLLSSILLPPVIFLGLGVTLWTQKCILMILFQNKIIYMPSIPPLSKFETIDDYAAECRPVRWREDSLVTNDRKHISLVIGEIEHQKAQAEKEKEKAKVREQQQEQEHVVVLFFQGNASSLPPRLPFLSKALKIAHAQPFPRGPRRISIVGVSYRGYWTSSGRPSQRGIERDASAALSWVLRKYAHTANLRIVLWGQSIGSGVATGLAAQYLSNPGAFYAESESGSGSGSEPPQVRPIHGLVLETPFTKMEDLLLAFYPQKWLPYHYLGPFLRSHWDSSKAGERLAAAQVDIKPRTLMLEAEKDEVVPAGNAEGLESQWRGLGLDVQRVVVRRALHSTVMVETGGPKAVAEFLRGI